MNKIKITCFSDTHGLHRSVNLLGGDIAIFAGDMQTCGYKSSEVLDFLEWYSQQDYEALILVAGNHDRFMENFSGEFKSMLKKYPNITYLENSGVNIAGINIYGVPDTHKFFNWAFNKTQDELLKIANKIPRDTNILITHGPALGVLDRLEGGERVGEPQFTDRLSHLRKLKFHISGHIHCDYGTQKVGFIQDLDYTAMNCAIVNEQYELQNEPITFEYE